jgi:hypothetical protein
VVDIITAMKLCWVSFAYPMVTKLKAFRGWPLTLRVRLRLHRKLLSNIFYRHQQSLTLGAERIICCGRA